MEISYILIKVRRRITHTERNTHILFRKEKDNR